MSRPLKLLRYNTGTDKKAFVHFKDYFDAVIFNATIVAYSGASVADLVSMHAHKYIIDPQTHILQQDFYAISSINKKDGKRKIKKSVQKYLECLTPEIERHVSDANGPIGVSYIDANLLDLVSAVYKFETGYVDSYIRNKDYDKYLQFAKVKPEPKVVIAPYFMLKSIYTDKELREWMELNNKALVQTIEVNEKKGNQYPVAGQLVLEKSVLTNPVFFELVKSTYNIGKYEYIFLWIDDFNSIKESRQLNESFSQLIQLLNSMGKKPVMAYGGYESILLCAEDCPSKLFGVAQSVGYGEYRPVTPVGGGVPVNKYYFYPLHERLKFGDVAGILFERGYFDDSIENTIRVELFYKNICDCKMCRKIIKKDINNFVQYNESIPFSMKTKNGSVERNRASTEALLISAFHFLYSKNKEWETVSTSKFESLKDELIQYYKEYCPEKLDDIEKWFQIYGSKVN